MNIELINNEEWFNALIEEVRAINVEGTHEARWVLINTYHEMGKRVLKDIENFRKKGIYGENIVQVIANSINSETDNEGNPIKRIDKRTLYYAIKFAKKFPQPTDELPTVLLTKMGKNVSWTKVIQHELTESKEECTHEEVETIQRCSKCKKIIKD